MISFKEYIKEDLHPISRYKNLHPNAKRIIKGVGIGSLGGAYIASKTAPHSFHHGFHSGISKDWGVLDHIKHAVVG